MYMYMYFFNIKTEFDCNTNITHQLNGRNLSQNFDFFSWKYNELTNWVSVI